MSRLIQIGFCLQTYMDMGNDGLEVTVELAKEAWNYFIGKRNLSKNVDSNFDMMLAAAEKLRAKRDDNERAVQQNRTKKTTSCCYNVWLSSVMKTLEKVETLRAEYDRERSSHFMRRSDYSCKFVNIYEEVQRLVEEGDFRGGSSTGTFLVDKPPQAVVKLNAPDIKGFPTLERSLQEILRLLRSDKLKRIGIFGTVGVGKSTIMKNLNNHGEVAKMFDVVIWVNVSRERREETLQLDIARRLKLDVEGCNNGIVMYPGEVARMISEELSDQKYLLLLDEVTDSIDLLSIGIPDDRNGSKVVLTTEFRHVCSLMTERMVKVDRLSSDEAWGMFQQIAAEKIDLPDVEPVARMVADECDRLPLVIRTVASSFKLKESDSEWRNGLRELEKWPEIEIPGLTNMHSFLKFCYDELKDDKKQKCFLYAALYPADSKIYADYLLECWAAEGLIGNNDDDRRRLWEARDEGYDILGHLTNVSLLEKGERMVYVQVSNSVRQVALYISSQDPDHFKSVIARKGETSSYSEKTSDWKEAKRISMIDGKLHDLPKSPNCSKLLSLLLQRNPELASIAPSFFKNMQKLLVLDLYQTGIASLPSSVSKLIRLKALFLNGCANITKLPLQVAELRFLEVLDIRGCKLIFIPLHIGKLVHLRCLRMSYFKCGNAQDCLDAGIDYKVISRLSRLEELMIDVSSYDHWCIDVARVIREVASLENLTSLRICFPRPEILKMLMEKRPSWRDRKQLKSFWFFIGCQNKNSPLIDCFEYKVNRYMRYCYTGQDDDSTILDLLPETDALELIGHKSIECLSDFMHFSGLNHVRGCLVERCNKMVTVLDGKKVGVSDNILPILEQLHLKNLLSLKSVFEGLIAGKSLSKLHTIVVKSCPMLTNILSNGVIQQLSKLKKLAIQSCFEVEELIQSNHQGMESISYELPSLEVLELVDLPKLRTLCNVGETMAWPSLKALKIFRCGELKMLPFDKDNAMELKLIEGEETWWNALQWRNIEVREHLQCFCSLR